MTPEETELARLVRHREDVVGIDLKRTNHKIAELQNRIDTQHERKAINITIRNDLKKRYTAFVAWLNRYHEADDGIWTQNTAMDEVLDHTWRWVAFLRTEGFTL